MSIVAIEVSIITTGPSLRSLYYRCQDDSGTWHDYGPVVTSDATFDADAFKATVAQRVADRLAEQEAEELLGG